MQHHKTSTFIAARNNAARRATLTGTVRLLWPYIWPADRADLKLRVFLAVALMLLSKLFTIAIPYSYKWATDAVAGKLALDAVPLPRVLIGAAALTLLYGALRTLMAFTQQGRDALFAAVAMNAVRRLAIEVFEHLHHLSLRFHLERKTGGLTRVLERGRNAIETIDPHFDADRGSDRSSSSRWSSAPCLFRSTGAMSQRSARRCSRT